MSAVSSRGVRTVVPVWILALVGAVAVGLLQTGEPLTWLPVVLAACVLLSFALQLALRRKEGLVTRLTAAIGGALAILAIATGVLAAVGAATA
jgi:hypothetical protein